MPAMPPGATLQPGSAQLARPCLAGCLAALERCHADEAHERGGARRKVCALPCSGAQARLRSQLATGKGRSASGAKRMGCIGWVPRHAMRSARDASADSHRPTGSAVATTDSKVGGDGADGERGGAGGRGGGASAGAREAASSGAAEPRAALSGRVDAPAQLPSGRSWEVRAAEACATQSSRSGSLASPARRRPRSAR